MGYLVDRPDGANFLLELKFERTRTSPKQEDSVTDATAAPSPEAELPQAQLAGFLSKYDPPIAAIAEAAAAELRRRLPNFLELVYDNYNALAIGFAPTERASDAVFSLAVFPRWVSLFFLKGNGLPDPARILKGSGKKARHIVLTTAADLNDPRVVALMNEALTRTAAARHPEIPYRMIIKSVSAKQRPRRPAGEEPAPASAGTKKSAKKPQTNKKSAAKSGKRSVAKPVRKRKAANLDQ
jgi:hypothetical protein